MGFNELFAKAKEIFMKVDTTCINGKLAFQFDLTGETGGTFYVEIKEGVISVEPYEYNDRDAKFILSTENFAKMLDGKLNSVMAYTLGQLKIEGDIGKALELKKLLGNE